MYLPFHPMICQSLFCLDILLIEDLQLHNRFANQPTTNIKLHYIEIISQLFLRNNITKDKIDKNTPLIVAIFTCTLQIQPLIVLTTSQREGIHTSTSITLTNCFKVPPNTSKQCKPNYTPPPFVPSMPSTLRNANLKPNSPTLSKIVPLTIPTTRLIPS